jgi:hypothetical protein
MNKKIVFLGILLMILTITGIGCYTILTHPTVQGEEAENVEQTGQYYREHCTDCHGDYHQYPYGFYYGYYPDYYFSNPRWGHYYAYPWWWDNYWWNNDNNNDNGAATVPESGEKAERRRGMEPPYVLPQGTQNTPFTPPTATNLEQPNQSGNTENQPQPVQIQEPQKQQPKEEKSDQEKAERRRK